MKYKDYEYKFKIRAVRVSAEIWELAKNKAEEQNIYLSDYIKNLIKEDNRQ